MEKSNDFEKKVEKSSKNKAKRKNKGNSKYPIK